MRVFRHLLGHKLALAVVLALLVCQAACDLALPRYTSEIVDVGIQQSGVEHVTCEVMSDATHSQLQAALVAGESSGSLELFDRSYDRDGALWRLNGFGQDNVSKLDELLSAPLAQIHREDGGGADAAGESSPGGDVLSTLDGDASDSLLRQQAIASTISEYEQVGYDLSGMQASYLARVGATMALVAALGMVVSILVSLVASRTGAKIGRDLRSGIFSRVVSFSEREVGRFSAASLITRGTNDVQLIQNISIMMMRMVLYAPILSIGGIVMVMTTSAELGWIVLVAILLVFALVGTLFRVTMPKFKAMQKLIDRVNLVAREMLSGMPVVRAFNRQPHEQLRFDASSAKLMRTQLFTNRAMSFMIPAMMLVMNATSVAIVWFGSVGVQNGSLQTGDLIAFITYAMVIIMGFLMIGMIAIMLPRANAASERVEEVLACEPSIQDPPPSSRAAVCDGSKGAGEPEGMPSAAGACIEFDDVSFCYDEGGQCEDVLSHVSFVAKPGQTLAIIGPTGSGKSTVLKLIERFYDVTEGSVKVDGVDVRDMSQRQLRSQLGYAPQKAFLFSGTIRSNVAYSDEGMDDAHVDEAIDVAQAREIVEQKPEGLESEISQGGTNVSGGQRQRFAIARAVATDARAFLFDDSFSALDYKTDQALRSALKKRTANATCIIVAQRIATVMGADWIVVLDEGRIVGQGAHEALLEDCAEYREIAMSQLSASELSIGGDGPWAQTRG